MNDQRDLPMRLFNVCDIIGGVSFQLVILLRLKDFFQYRV